TERYHPQVPEGRVVRTEPAAGTTLRPDAEVQLVVSLGPRPIRVGDWVGDPLEDARAALERRGLRVEVVGEEFSDDVPEGAVIGQ
ncbi:PASTA domain-containing protein, partial [Klebsiella pneumoniae]|uniref:PASTA domain-containing protein n=1 Tax=Klebsiella pneumoniae TaxID=573 RepID=UPI003F277D5D